MKGRISEWHFSASYFQWILAARRAMRDLFSAMSLAAQAASGFSDMPPLFECYALKSALFI